MSTQSHNIYQERESDTISSISGILAARTFWYGLSAVIIGLGICMFLDDPEASSLILFKVGGFLIITGILSLLSSLFLLLYWLITTIFLCGKDSGGAAVLAAVAEGTIIYALCKQSEKK